MSKYFYDRAKQIWVAQTASAPLPLEGIAPIASGHILGRVSVGTGLVEQLSTVQVKTLLDFSSLASTAYVDGGLVGKQNTLTLTTTGTSGAATLIGSTLNIPDYATGGGGLAAFTEGVNSTSPNNIVPINYLTPVSGSAHADFGFFPKGEGAIVASMYITGTSTLLHKRGVGAVDLQLFTSDIDHVAGMPYSFLNSGYLNKVSGGSAYSCSGINGGQQHRIVASSRSVISGGLSNVIEDFSDDSVILGGLSSTLSEASYCFIASSAIRVSSIGKSNVAFLTGSFYQARRPYTVYISGAGVVANGDCLNSLIALRCSTTNATVTALTTQGTPATSSNQVPIQPNGGIVFVGEVVAKQQNSTNGAAWKVECWAVLNAAGTVVTLKSSTVTALAGNAAWTLAIAADSANQSVRINFTGSAATNILVNATLRVTETFYN